MTAEPLNLHIGDSIRLQRISPDNNDRYNVKLIGYLPGQSLLVTMPMVDGKLHFLKEGYRFAVRILWGSDVQAFVCRVIHVALKPYPHIHLSYPEDIETVSVRNAERFDTNLHGLVRNTQHEDRDENWHPMLIKNLSMTGARTESVQPLGKRGERLIIRFGIEVCGSVERLELLGEIKNRSMSGEGDADDSRYILGIAFIAINRFQEVLLRNCILENKSKHD